MVRLLSLLPKPIADLRHNKLITNTGVYVFGSVLQQALAFLLIPIYTRFLTPEDYGITGLTLAAGSVLTPLLGLGIPASVARYYYEYKNSPQDLKSYVTTNFLALAVVSGGATLVLSFFGDAWWNQFTSGQVPYSPYMLLVIWASYSTVLSRVSLALYRTQQKARSYMTAEITTFSVNLAATLLFVVVWQMGATGQLLGRLVAFGSVALVLSVLLLKTWFSPRLRLSHLRTALQFGLPLVPHQLSSWVKNYIDRLLLEPRIPLAELGLYNLANQIGLSMALLVNSINLAWSPYYYNLMKESQAPEKRILEVADLYTGGVGGLCLLGGLFSAEILLLITPKEYHAGAVYIPLILFSYLLNGYYYFVIMPLYYHKKTGLIPLITLVSALANIGLNLWWIPFWGAMGSAWASLVTFAATLVVTYFIGQRWHRVDYPLGKYGAVNGLIFVGIVLAAYHTPMSIQWGELAWKSLYLLLFAVIAYLWLVKPNLGLLRMEQSR